MRLSIITINYNNKDGLQKTIDSVISQTFTDFEWIIIDGGSTDGSKELIEQYTDKLTYWVSEIDTGIYNAMNKGVKIARGGYLLFLNSGDRIHDEKVIENMVEELDGTDFVAGDEWCVDKDYKYLRTNRNPEKVTKYRMLVWLLWHQCTFIKTEILKKRLYDESLKIVADWEQMFYELLFNNRTYKHCNIIISDFVLGGISDTNESLRCVERRYICNKYLSKREQDIILIEHIYSIKDENLKNQLVQIAYSALVNQSYSQEEYKEMFYEYQVDMRGGGTWYQWRLVQMCLNGEMKRALRIRCILRCFLRVFSYR